MHITANFHGFITDSKEELAMFKKQTIAQMNVIGKERGWQPYSETSFDRAVSHDGNLIVGTSSEVVEKLNFLINELSLDRVLLQSTVGTMPLEVTMRNIERLALEVKPKLKR